jgi:hypothetical protein
LDKILPRCYFVHHKPLKAFLKFFKVCITWLRSSCVQVKAIVCRKGVNRMWCSYKKWWNGSGLWSGKSVAVSVYTEYIRIYITLVLYSWNPPGTLRACQCL